MIMRFGVALRCEISLLNRSLKATLTRSRMYAEYRATITANTPNEENTMDKSDTTPVLDEVKAAGAEAGGKREARKSPKSAVVIIPPDHLNGQIQAIREKHDKGFIRWMPHINMLWPFLEDINDGEVFSEARDRLTAALANYPPFRVSFTKDSFGYFEHKKFCTLWLKPIDEEEVEAAKTANEEGDKKEMNAEAGAGVGMGVGGSQNKTTETTNDSHKRKHQTTTESRGQNHASNLAASKSESKDSNQEEFTEVKPKSKRKKQKKQPTKRTNPHRAHIPFHQGVISLQRHLEETIPECNDLGANFEGFKPHLSLGQFKANTVEEDLATFQADWQEFEFEVREVYMISRKDYHDPFHVQYAIKLGGGKD